MKIKAHIEILRAIIDSQNHDIDCITAKEAIYNLRTVLLNTPDDFTFDFDDNEYRIISESAIWKIYVLEIKNIVDTCYDLKLNELPNFIAIHIDWEKTAENAYVDGYGHTFNSYDGSEEQAGGYYIFRIN